MSIPTDLFTNTAGLAVMRRDNNTGEWSFVGWANKSAFVERLSPGNYTYAVWFVVGSGAPSVASVRVNGTPRLAVVQATK